MPPPKIKDYRITCRLSELDHKAIEILSDGKTSSYCRVIIQNHLIEMSKRRIDVLSSSNSRRS